MFPPPSYWARCTYWRYMILSLRKEVLLSPTYNVLWHSAAQTLAEKSFFFCGLTRALSYIPGYRYSSVPWREKNVSPGANSRAVPKSASLKTYLQTRPGWKVLASFPGARKIRRLGMRLGRYAYKVCAVTVATLYVEILTADKDSCISWIYKNKSHKRQTVHTVCSLLPVSSHMYISLYNAPLVIHHKSQN